MEAPASFKKLRRETGSSHSECWRGNSRSSSSPNAASCCPESSSSDRQNLGPLASANCLRMASSSLGAALMAFTGTRLGFESLVLDIRFRIVFHFYRWHVEQLVMSCTVRRLYFFANLAPNSSWL